MQQSAVRNRVISPASYLFAILTVATFACHKKQIRDINHRQITDKQLHTAYYCFGTAKELKDQKILSGGGLFAKSKVLQSGFNKDYFISIDIREVKENPAVRRQGKAEIQSPGRFLRICEGRGRQYDIEDHGRKSVLEPWQVFGD